MKENKGQFRTIYKIDTQFFHDKNKHFYYFLGLMSSDGNVKNDSVFSFTQSNEKGEKLISFVQEFLKSNHVKYYNTKNNSYTITVSNKEIVKILKEFNVIKNKTLSYSLPEKINHQQLKYFLQGYIEGDGSIGIYDNGRGVKSLIVSIVGTEQFIKSLNNKLSSKGNVRKIKKCKNLYEIRYNGKKALDLCYEIYEDPIYSNGKHNSFLNFVNDSEVGKRYKKYYQIKNIVISKLICGFDIGELSKEYGVPKKTLYTWRYRGT